MRLNEEQRRHIIEMLLRGEALPSDYQRLLFPEQANGVTLMYAGKEPTCDILDSAPAATLYPIRTFGEEDGSWRNRLIFGDNLPALKALLNEKQAGTLQNADGSSGIRLIYIDPPFATRQDFRADQDQQAYQDRLEGAEFLEFLRKRLVLLRELLAENGSLYVHLSWQMSHAVKLLLDEIFGRAQFQNDIAWCYREAINSRKRWNRKHDSILFYSRSETFLFNCDAVLGEYAESNRRKYRLQDEKGVYRIMGRGITDSPLRSRRDLPVEYETLYPGLTYRHYLGMGTLPVDYWLIDIENQASKARTGYPTQKPEALLERIIRASSNPGDLVLDAFAGSGTTCAVAEKLDRRWIAIDSGRLAIHTIQKRMLNLRAGIAHKGKPLTPRAFQLYGTELPSSSASGIQCSVGMAIREGQLYAEAYLQVDTATGGEQPTCALEALSLLLLDYNYGGEQFKVAQAVSAEALAETGGRVLFPLEALGAQLGALIVDIQGNETLVTVRREEFSASG